MLTVTTPGAQLASAACNAVSPAAGGAVAGRGRYRDHDAAHQAADHAEQRTFHTGDHDDRGIAAQLLLVLQDAPEARDAHVGDLARRQPVECERA